MKGNNGLKFAIVMIIILIATYLVGYGSTALNVPNAENIRFGIDISGGVYARLYPDKPLSEVTNDQLDAAKTIIAKRLDNQGILDRTLYTEPENKRIVLEIPWKSGEVDFNPQSVIDELGKTALLTFQEVDESMKDEDNNYLPTGKIIIKGDHVKNAIPQLAQSGRDMEVRLEITNEAAVLFEEATGRLIGKPIAIFMDDLYISSPIVSDRIDVGNDPVITLGRMSMEEARKEAKELADTIRAGALPFKLEAQDLTSISPTLGDGALRVAINAGIISFFLVFLFMLIYYRLPGMLANVALFSLVVFQLLAIAALGVTLTLPGIAGIILSVGMGVDANIIIFERIKEELKSGKTLKTSIELGFKRAFSAIFDANVTTLISAIVLYWLGSGPIKGFAITLGLGVTLSFITAITATKIFMRFVSGIEATNNKWLYGVGGEKA